MKKIISSYHIFFYKYYDWRGSKDKLDDKIIWFFAALGFLVYLKDTIADTILIYLIFPSLAFYENFNLAVILSPFVMYFYLTFSNLVIHKFNFKWLKTKGWKISLDTTFVIFLFGFIGFNYEKFPKVYFFGLELFLIIVIIIFIFLIYFVSLIEIYSRKIFTGVWYDKDIIDFDLGKSKLPICEGSDRSKWNYCIGKLESDATTFIGEFKNGKIYGLGKFINHDKGKTIFEIVGHFDNSKFPRYGVFSHLKNKYLYKGEMKDGNFHGKGTMTYSKGKKVEKVVGIWKNGQLIKDNTK